MNIQAVRGTQDFFGENIKKFNYVVDEAKKVSKLYNFKELITPIFEFSEVFEKNLGETSDVVAKEIYKFQDKSDNFLSLRPEFTAGVVRSILTNKDLQKEIFPLKLFSFGPIFRYDRPQKGRYRQFNQLNFENYGNASYLADLEILSLANDIIKNLNLKNITLELNSLGSEESRKNFENSLYIYLQKYKNDLSDDSKVRLEKNILKVLDSKSEIDQKILLEAPKINEFYSAADEEFFNSLLEKLTLYNIDYKINNNLVRGLDYYTSTVFEFTTTDLGAQATVLGGGRYDNLVKNMGGGNVPAVGFAGGIERLMLLLNNQLENTQPISIIAISDNEINYCLNLQKYLKEQNIVSEFFYVGKMKRKIEDAVKSNSKHCLIIGENEINTGDLTLKNLETSENSVISKEKIKDLV